MKILHTADWHIGKVLHRHPLRDELKLFFDWLYMFIQKEKVDLLLISGDIFDLANPSAEDKSMYYNFLRRLNQLHIKVIITGGNHDSVGFLNAPAEVLDVLNITIIGGATENIEDEIISINDNDGKPQLSIAAVPFLRDKDLRNAETDQQYENRAEAIREGIKNHYLKIAQLIEDKYPSCPSIAMGHLYVAGSELSESERDIHIGNSGAVGSDIFSTHYDYVALGHIHRPQVINDNKMIRYSGSPIALSFSEHKDEKQVVLIELKDGKLQEPEVIKVPKFRMLKRFKGNLEKIKKELTEFKPDFPLVSFVELEINESEFSNSTLIEVETLKARYALNESFKILKDKTSFKSNEKDSADLFKAGTNIEELTAMEVFEKKLEEEAFETKKASMLKEMFQILIEEAEQETA